MRNRATSGAVGLWPLKVKGRATDKEGGLKCLVVPKVGHDESRNVKLTNNPG